MNILFIHQNYPAQYKHLAPALVARGHTVKALSYNRRPVSPAVESLQYQYSSGMTAGIHPLAAEQEVKIIRAEAVALRVRQLIDSGFLPDVVYVHPGWGEARFLREVLPTAKIVVYCEYYYNATDQDVDFDAELGQMDFAGLCRLRQKNTDNLHAFQIGDAFVAPTLWQRDTYPKIFRDNIQVIHEGVDFSDLAVTAPLELELPSGSKIISYVSRNLEPMRGFHVFMRALPAVLAANPDAQVVIVGGDASGYGKKEGSGLGWRKKMLAELGDSLDQSRVHFLGKLPYDRYKALLAVTHVHVYLTYPFVLSWSLLEAAAVCRQLLVSDTAPLAEVDVPNMQRVGFFDVPGLSQGMIEALEREIPTPKTVPDGLSTFTLESCLQQHLALFEALTQ